MKDMLRVGQLAKATGLSVRTLHWYDEVGLLRPAARSAAGYRLYSGVEVRRLQQITSLRHLGLSLEDVAACLESSDTTLASVLDSHIARLRLQMEGQRRLVARLEEVRGRLEPRTEGSPQEGVPREVSTNDLLTTIREVIMYEKYYTPEQMEQLRQRTETVGQDRIQQVEREWAEVFEGLRNAMDAGADPADESVRALGRKSLALIQEFTGGDPGIERSLATMYRAEGPAPVNRHEGFDVSPELWSYMASAQAAARSEGTTGDG
ncbi:MAG TPA: MerR family transcriptional regulator [Longimicrobiales bacterium]|jgi:DNA-binding transcriptional MerR regulator